MLQAHVEDRKGWNQLFRDAEPRRAVEQLIADTNKENERWTVPGWCDVCSRASAFVCDWAYSNGKTPNFRERLVCGGCDLNARQRRMFRLVRELVRKSPESADPSSIYVYEQVTPLYAAFVAKLGSTKVVGSEYLGHDVAPGTYRDAIRHEDALALSFDDSSFDLIVSNDVYEHVPDIERALSEAVRVLKPGGTLLATLPFSFGPITEQRARLVDGVVEHLLPPEFHGNPLSEKGSLVFFLYGWDLLDMCRAAGFTSTVGFECVHSFFHGYLGADLGMVLRATKSA